MKNIKTKTKMNARKRVRRSNKNNQYRLMLWMSVAIAIILVGALAYDILSKAGQQNYSSNIPSNLSVQSNGSVIGQTANGTTQLYASIFPQNGFTTPVKLGDIIPQLIASGAINISKVKLLYGDNLTQQELDIFTKPSYSNLTLNSSNANFYLLAFWALGISNKNEILDNFSALASAQNYSIADFASTGGWTLGTNSSVMAYFNKLQLLNLTPQQQNIMYDVATHTYRPCCDNPTAFPDCNHGAALLALLELGASEGLNESQLYTLALQAQTLWFPSYYIESALELHTKNISYWGSPQAVLGRNYSTASGWYYDVYKPLEQSKILPNGTGGGASCAA